MDVDDAIVHGHFKIVVSAGDFTGKHVKNQGGSIDGCDVGRKTTNTCGEADLGRGLIEEAGDFDILSGLSTGGIGVFDSQVFATSDAGIWDTTLSRDCPINNHQDVAAFRRGDDLLRGGVESQEFCGGDGVGDGLDRGRSKLGGGHGVCTELVGRDRAISNVGSDDSIGSNVVRTNDVPKMLVAAHIAWNRGMMFECLAFSKKK